MNIQLPQEELEKLMADNNQKDEALRQCERFVMSYLLRHPNDSTAEHLKRTVRDAIDGIKE